jgi:hypothetical protein
MGATRFHVNPTIDNLWAELAVTPQEVVVDIERLAKRQLSDYDRHQPGGLFAGYSFPMTVDDAYALQMAVARLRMERGAGRRL